MLDAIDVRTHHGAARELPLDLRPPLRRGASRLKPGVDVPAIPERLTTWDARGRRYHAATFPVPERSDSALQQFRHFRGANDPAGRLAHGAPRLRRGRRLASALILAISSWNSGDCRTI